MFRKLSPLQPYALSIMRIVIGFMFTCHGGQKLFGWFGGLGSTHAAAAFGTLIWFAGVCEFFGGILITLGLFTSCVAFVVCGEMAFAYFIQHAPQGLWPTRNGGELAVLYCFIYLHFVTAGGGAWSLDRWLRKA